MKKIIDGYVYIKRFGHPYAHNNYVAEHRLAIEMFIGRYLKPEESVHHINGIRWDNRIENLMLFPNHSEHKRFENKVRQFGFTHPIQNIIKSRWEPYIIRGEPISVKNIVNEEN